MQCLKPVQLVAVALEMLLQADHNQLSEQFTGGDDKLTLTEFGVGGSK